MSELLQIAKRVADLAVAGEQVEVFIARESDTEVKAYNGEVESLTVAESHGVGIRVVSGNRQGFAYAGALDEAVLAETLAEARDNAEFAQPDEFNGVATDDGVATADIDLYRDDLAAMSTDEKVALAIELERATLAADDRIVGIEAAEFVDAIYESAVATNTGIASSTRETGCYLSSYALAEADGETQTGFGFSVGRSPSELDIEVAAADAATRATRLLGAVKAPTSRLTVVFDPWVTAQLLGIIGHTLTGDAVLKRRSLFAERLGEDVAASSITLVDDPTDPAAFTASIVDGEGLATRSTKLIDNGTLAAFLHNTYSGRRSGTASTGSAVRPGFKGASSVGAQALRILPGSRSPQQLISEVEHGLLVQEVSGLHSGVNPVSGDFSTGAEGMMIRGGEIAEPIREVTIASTLQRILQDVVAVGNDLEWLPMSAAGTTLVIADVTMSGI